MFLWDDPVSTFYFTYNNYVVFIGKCQVDEDDSPLSNVLSSIFYKNNNN
jgi:hypothetical protein